MVFFWIKVVVSCWSGITSPEPTTEATSPSRRNAMIPKKKLHMIFDSSTAQSQGHNTKDDDDHPQQTPNLNGGASTSYTGRLLTEDEIKKEPVEEKIKQEK